MGMSARKEARIPDLSITIEIWRKGNWFLATAPELDFVSQGTTFEEAKKNLMEVIKIQFDEMKEMGTLEDYLAECGFIAKEGQIVPQKEIVGFENRLSHTEPQGPQRKASTIIRNEDLEG
jgi:predicted RNase H-like HicB family nuclease